PSITDGLPPRVNLTRAPFELACRPSPASMTPAFTNSSLNLPISASSSVVGRTPASDSLLALTITMNRIFVSLNGSVSNLMTYQGWCSEFRDGLGLARAAGANALRHELDERRTNRIDSSAWHYSCPQGPSLNNRFGSTSSGMARRYVVGIPN